ncbi:inositol monophosphatase family protein [Microbacterium oryzae]|uniref:inositol monophosphatase family protein n=1 Tax=Microbacterium oryzae TaxID=743009 RepID=UPI0025AECFCE|nr:inositol monophosphatase family protein [Microbacterium oryzae]MDN3310773.1 inositol monophosphatase family protein [Microbacterium oryzae]
MNTASPTPAAPALDGLADDLALALRLADAADAQTLPRFDAADLQVSRKADRTHVTDADLAAERAIRELITAERPQDAIFGEEFGRTDEAPRRWIIDPIDGTANFLRGVPAWGTMIALDIAGYPRLGVVSSPAMRRRWWAAEGLGAWTSVDGGEPRPIHVSGVDDLDDASVSFQSIAQWDGAGHLDALVALSRRVWRDRAYGDIWAYMLLAEGRLEFVAEFDVKEYDLAAAAAIVTEAGGRMTSFTGAPSVAEGSALATNGVLHDAFLELLSSASPLAAP